MCSKILDNMQALKEKCEEIINFFASNAVHRLVWTQALSTDIVSALIGILILGLPNLRELYLGPSWLMDYPFFSQIPSQEIRNIYPSWWEHLYLTPVLKQLQSRLTVLEFPANFKGFYFTGMPRAIFDFRGFQHLTELNISMKALFWTSLAPWRSPADPSTILPRSLEVLRVSECNETTANFANQLCLLIKQGQFPALRRVELYFEHWRQKIEMDAEEFRCMHPVKDTRKIFLDVGLELYLYFPGVEWNTPKFGSTPWSCRAEGLLQEAESIALNLQGVSFNTFEVKVDREGDVEMGGSKY
jgi:hypothetical protein